MYLTKNLTRDDVLAYHASPIKSLSEWSRHYDVLAVEDRHVLLRSDTYGLIKDKRLLASGRVPALENSLPVKLWPMYLDGERHVDARYRYSSFISKVSRVLKGDEAGVIQANIGKQAVLSKLLGVYAQAFEISLDYLYECYNNFVDMHRAVLSRQPELASKKWKEITAFKKSPCLPWKGFSYTLRKLFAAGIESPA